MNVDSRHLRALVGLTHSLRARCLLTACLACMLTLACVVSASAAASGKQVWVKTYGSEAEGARGTAVATGPGGAVYTAGSIGEDLLLIRYDADGSCAWAVPYHNAAGASWATALAVDSEGNVLVGGEIAYYPLHTDMLLLKYSPAGTLLWDRLYDGPASSVDYVNAIAVDPARNLYAVGPSWSTSSATGVALLKYSTDGDQEWVTRIDPGPASPGVSDFSAGDIALDATGNVYVAGSLDKRPSGSYLGYWSAVTWKFAPSDGHQLKQAVYSGLAAKPALMDGANENAIAVRGSCVVVSGGVTRGATTDALVIRYDLNLKRQSLFRYHRANTRIYASDVALDAKGCALVTGTATPNGGGSHLVSGCQTIKLTPKGKVVWSKLYKPKGQAAGGNRLALDASGNVYLAGYRQTHTTDKDLLVLKYSSAGAMKWAKVWQGTGDSEDQAEDLALQGDALYVAGFSHPAFGDDLWSVLAKYTP